MKKFYNIIAFVMVALTGLSITACSDDDLDTNPYSKGGVNLLAFGPAPTERGQEIRITGTNMNKVDKVVFPADETTAEAAVLRSEFTKADNENIYLNIPDATVPGNIKLVVGNDTVTSEGILTYTEPIKVTSVTPTTGLNAGDIITIKGDYVYNIASVTFTAGVEVPAEEFVKTSRRELQVRVPLAAESGAITLTDGNEWVEEFETPLEILSATATALSKTDVEFGDEITITGTNLHTVEAVKFPGGVNAEFTVSSDNKTITTTVPAETKSGAISLLLYSGAVVSAPEIAVPTVEISSISKAEDIVAGDEITLTGVNFDRVQKVTVPGGGDVEFKLDGNKITFTAPDGVADGDIVLTQNAYITASTSISVRKMAGIVWMGNVECTSAWSGALQAFTWDNEGKVINALKEAMTGPGVMTLGIETTGDAQIKIAGSDWNSPVFSSIPADCILHPAQGDKEISFNVTEDDLEKLFDPGFVIYGCNYKLKYIKYVVATAERTIWEGSETMNWDKNQKYIGTDAGQEFIDAGVQEGWVVRFYGTTSAQTWQLQVFEGHWGPQYGAWAGSKPDDSDPVIIPDLEAEGGCVKFTLTKAMIDAALTQQWWGGIFVIQGQEITVTKVTVCPL